MADSRPDPDQLLERIKAEEARARRGHLRIFFGGSAGVGKTYAMLEAARSLQSSGTDVLVGYVEPGPGQEPSAARYGDIVKLCKDHHVHLIATEQQYSDAAAKNIQEELKKREVGEVVLARVDPMEAATHEDLSDPNYYVKTMRANIDNLVDGLK